VVISVSYSASWRRISAARHGDCGMDWVRVDSWLANMWLRWGYP